MHVRNPRTDQQRSEDAPCVTSPACRHTHSKHMHATVLWPEPLLALRSTVQQRVEGAAPVVHTCMPGGHGNKTSPSKRNLQLQTLCQCICRRRAHNKNEVVTACIQGPAHVTCRDMNKKRVVKAHSIERSSVNNTGGLAAHCGCCRQSATHR